MIFQSISRQKNKARVDVEPISKVEWMGTIVATGKTVLVVARTIIAPPAENAALQTAARKLPATIMKNVASSSFTSLAGTCFCLLIHSDPRLIRDSGSTATATRGRVYRYCPGFLRPVGVAMHCQSCYISVSSGGAFMITLPGHKLKLHRLSAVTCLVTLLLAGACASNSELVRSKLDPRTSVTISYSKSPFIFFRPLSAAQADAKEYVYAGPLEVNRSGDYRYYLWLSSWGTMDSGEIDTRQQRFEAVDIIADGNAITLKVAGESEAAIGASEPVYPKPAGWATDLYYEVTVEQLRTIAAASSLQLRFRSTSETFLPWDDHVPAKAGLNGFLLQTQF